MHTKDDISEEQEIYEKVLRRNHDMWKAALITLRLRRHAKFPINSLNEGMKYADLADERFELEDDVITLKQIEKYFPKRFFPIEDEEDCISKVLIALTWGTKCHALEAELHMAKLAIDSPPDISTNPTAHVRQVSLPPGSELEFLKYGFGQQPTMGDGK